MAARGLDRPARLELLDRAYAALTSKFAARRPEEQACTWYSHDQRVGFWIRRMAKETVIHRVDAELADGEPLAAIPADLAQRHRRAADRFCAIRHDKLARGVR